jgi:hypothetical protein
VNGLENTLRPTVLYGPSGLFLFIISAKLQPYVTFSRDGRESTRYRIDLTNPMPVKRIPFRIEIAIPMPLRTGYDYGFPKRKAEGSN